VVECWISVWIGEVGCSEACQAERPSGQGLSPPGSLGERGQGVHWLGGDVQGSPCSWRSGLPHSWSTLPARPGSVQKYHDIFLLYV